MRPGSKPLLSEERGHLQECADNRMTSESSMITESRTTGGDLPSCFGGRGNTGFAPPSSIWHRFAEKGRVSPWHGGSVGLLGFARDESMQ